MTNTGLRTSQRDLGHHAYGRDELLACGRGELFGPANARLPLPNMLMFDRIVRIDDTGGAHGKGQIDAELDIRPDMARRAASKASHSSWLGSEGIVTFSP